MKQPITHTTFLDPSKRPWIYFDGSGERVHRDDIIKPWTDKDEQEFIKEYNKKLEK